MIPEAAFTPVLALKLALVPVLMLAITQAGQRWGPGVAGWLSGFPVIAGPVLLFVYLDHGTVFAADAALATLANVPANVAFGLAYAWLARRLPWPACWALGTLAFFAVTTFLQQMPLSVPLAVLCNATVLLLAPQLFPADHHPPQANTVSRTEMASRMVAGGLVALAISLFALALGARWAGSLSVFPVLGSLLAAFTHRRCDAATAAHLLRGQAIGMVSFSVFALCLHTLLPRDAVAAFCIALFAAAAVQRMTLALVRRRVLEQHANADR